MRTILVLIFFACIFIVPVLPQTEMATGENAYENSPRYFEELLDFYSGDKGTTRVDIFIQLPYSSVQFVSGNNKFVSIYTTTLSVFDRDKEKLIAEFFTLYIN